LVLDIILTESQDIAKLHEIDEITLDLVLRIFLFSWRIS
jgi:hypothetical protein